MSAKTFLTINAIVSVVFGLAFLLAPTMAGSVYGVPPRLLRRWPCSFSVQP